LHLGYVVTDYYSQGCSFLLETFFLHLRARSWEAGNLRVPLTRPSSLADVHLLAPIDEGMTRAKAVDRLRRVLKPPKSYLKEMERLAKLQEQCLGKPENRAIVDACKKHAAELARRKAVR